MRCEKRYVKDYSLVSGFVSLVNAGATDIGEGTGWRQGRWDEFVGIEKKYFQPSYIS